ncbi:MAG: hypothetical protein FH753_01665, partial [Firmicutes bacterium]|nr:hypothetical protein [Bacillota bacterium]
MCEIIYKLYFTQIYTFVSGGENVKVTIMLKQHVGGPCKPIVSKGEEVKKGQLIAEPEGLGANIH